MNAYAPGGRSLRDELGLNPPQMAESIQAYELAEKSPEYGSYEKAFRAFLFSDAGMVTR